MDEIVKIEKVELKENKAILSACTEDDALIFYISDLHIDYRIKKNDNADEIITKIVNKLVKSIRFSDYSNCKVLFTRIVIIAGDVSDNFEYFKKFFREYVLQIGDDIKTIFVPGNHDVWNSGSKGKQHIDKRLDIIKNYFNKYKTKPIVMLNNEIYFPDSDEVKNCDELFADENYRDIFNRNSFAIFGGMGYAGCNIEFNCENNIYNGTLINRCEEIERSKYVDEIHNKLSKIVRDKTIIFVTHMPKSDWSNDSEYVDKWFYISGHTHKPRAYLTEDSALRIRDDNQIGYEKMNYAFKFFYTSKVFNPFCDFVNGIYEIAREEYVMFYNGLGERIDFNRDFNNLYMIKKNDAYMFLMRNKEDKLYMLQGGNIRKLNHDLEYYYKNIDTFVINANTAIDEYERCLNNIKEIIKSIGGNGRIHGCIIDIDFYNHIYVNPYDDKTTPYHATSIVDKYPKKDLSSLLKKYCPKLYPKWCKLYISSRQCQELLPNSSEKTKKCKPDTNTAIYKISRIMLDLQRIYKFKLVRVWSDNWVKDLSLETGKIIVKNLIENDVDYDEKSNKKTP